MPSRTPTESPSDATLIPAACAGDRDAMEQLVRRHYDAAFAVAMAITRTTVDAEDVCHDSLVRAAKQLESCRDHDRFRAWLCTIVRNQAHNFMTRGRNARRVVDVSATELDSGDDVARRLELSELRKQISNALATLSEAQRQVVLLHDLSGWPHDEIAQLMGTSPGMCRQHLFRARRILRGALGSTLEEYKHD